MPIPDDSKPSRVERLVFALIGTSATFPATAKDLVQFAVALNEELKKVESK